tara:strand:+ start:375 stop:815 length:441 start_codon:yes stop_codon:yes gene_type:complete
MNPINKQSSEGMSHGQIDYKDPSYPLAAKIVDHLINTGIIKRNAHINSAVSQTMLILNSRDVIINEQTISKDLLDLEHKKLAEKKACRTSRRKEISENHERKMRAIEKEESFERQFYNTAKGLLDVSDFIAVRDIALINEKARKQE